MRTGPSGWTWIALAGAAGCVAGFFLDPARLAFSYLVAYVSASTVALGALALVMIAHVTGATWFVVLRRRAEDVMATLPLFALLFVPLLPALPVLYPWAAPSASVPDEMRTEIARKAAYLNVPFFVVRAGVCWAVFVVLAELLRRASLRQDARAEREAPADAEAPARPHATDAVGRPSLVSAIGLVLYAPTLTIIAIDWLMSLEPAWSSTIYGVSLFAAALLAALSLMALFTRWTARSAAVRRTLTPDHARALGSLMLAVVLFWVYTAYVQLLIIWIGDLPREVAWYVHRSGGGWDEIAALLVIGKFAIPFLLLLLRGVRRSTTVLALLGAWLLLMHVTEIYWLIMPAFTPGLLRLHWLDAATLAFVAASAVLFARWRATGLAALPLGDPALMSSEHYRRDQR